MTRRRKVRKLRPSGFEDRPVTDEELAVWAALTPEQQSWFGGELTGRFREVLDEAGEEFPRWLETAKGISEAVKQSFRNEKADDSTE